MKKVFVFLSVIFLTSCGARKVAINKQETLVKVDSISTTIKEVTATQENNINIVTNIDEFEVCPVSDTIPMVVNGITYKNAKLRYKKTKVVLSDTTKTKVSEKASIEVKLKKDTTQKLFKKDVEKKAVYSSYWGWILLFLLLALYTYKKLNKTLL